MNQLEFWVRHLDRISAGLGKSAAWVALPIIAITLFDVVLRRFFVVGSVTLQELEWHFHAILFLFCAAWAYLNDAHVRVDVFRQQMSPYRQAWIELLGSVFFLIPYCLVMVVLGARFAFDSFLLGEISDAPGGLPYRFLIKSTLPIGFFFLLLQGISMTFKQILVIKNLSAEGSADVR